VDLSACEFCICSAADRFLVLSRLNNERLSLLVFTGGVAALSPVKGPLDLDRIDGCELDVSPRSRVIELDDDRVNRWDLVLGAVLSLAEGGFWTTGLCVEGGATGLAVPDVPAKSEDDCLDLKVI
jgi:hypothetical protein